MTVAYICDGLRTPIGRYGGALSSVRPDDMLAHVIKEVMARNPGLDVDEVLAGCANQAGEDNRNVARMAVLLAGLPDAVPGVTLTRLCGSGMDAVIAASRAIRAGRNWRRFTNGCDRMFSSRCTGRCGTCRNRRGSAGPAVFRRR